MNKLAAITKKDSGYSFIEILLTMLIIAVIAYFAIRYYKISSVSREADAVIAEMNAINAAATKLAQATNSFAGNVTTDSIASVVSNGGMQTPWGSQISVTGVASNSYTVNIPDMPGKVCKLVMQEYANNSSYDMSSISCPSDPNATTTFTYTYFRN